MPERSLNVAFFTDSFAPTNDGVAKVTDSLARTLVRRGHNVTVFTVGGSSEPRTEVRGDGVRVHRYFALPAPSYPQYRVALYPWVSMLSGRGRFDVVHIHTPGFVGLAGRLAARRWGVPTVGTYHTNLSDMLRGSGKNRWSRAFFRTWGRFSIDLCRGCDLATAPTEGARAPLRGSGRVPLRRAPRVIPNGVDTTAFRPEIHEPNWRVRLGLPDASLVTFLGRLTRDKGVHRFLDAIQEVTVATPWVAVVGGEGPQRESMLARLKQQRDVGWRVRYVGPVREEEKAALLAQTEVFVLPSLSDTSSVALLEAMACGAPCVVTSRGGPAEIARSSSCGIVVDPESPGELRAAIERLLTDRALRRELSVRGHQWVTRNASADSMAAAYVAAYWTALGREPAAP